MCNIHENNIRRIKYTSINEKRDSCHVTYINDEEVEPTPVVGEVLSETVGQPLEQHLQDEDVCENLVGKFQHHLNHPPLLNVDVLKGLPGAAESQTQVIR